MNTYMKQQMDILLKKGDEISLIEMSIEDAQDTWDRAVQAINDKI